MATRFLRRILDAICGGVMQDQQATAIRLASEVQAIVERHRAELNAAQVAALQAAGGQLRRDRSHLFADQ